MAIQPRFCGRCGAQVAPGAPFCGRCGAPVATQALVAQPVYSYPMAQQATYPTAGRYKLSQVAIAGGLLLILAAVTIALSAFAVSHFIGGTHATCTVTDSSPFSRLTSRPGFPGKPRPPNWQSQP